MEDGTGMTMAEQIGWQRWLDEVAGYCREFDPTRGCWYFSDAEMERLAQMDRGGYSSLAAAEILCPQEDEIPDNYEGLVSFNLMGTGDAFAGAREQGGVG